MISSIGHSQLINHNFLCNPSPNQRSFHLDNSPRDSKNLLPDQKSLPPQEKSLKLPFPHFPLEIPKISKLFYRAPNQILHKRWISQRMSSRNSVGSQDTTLPSLANLEIAGLPYQTDQTQRVPKTFQNDGSSPTRYAGARGKPLVCPSSL